MRVLLIGGTGVISTDVTSYAIEKGIEIFVLNRGKRLNRLAKGAKLIVADIRNVREVESKLAHFHCDVVVDFLSFVPEHLENSISLFKNRCKQFVFISSATVYQEQANGGAITEQTPLANPFFKYAQDKIECERLLQEQCDACRLAYTIVRPYVTYGDTRIPFAIIPGAKQWSLVNRILLGKPVVMWDKGDAICTLTHTTDFAKALVGLFGNDMAMRNIYHIASDERFRWSEVLDIIAKTVNKEAVVVNIPSQYIAKQIPELYGVLHGDKTRSMVFDNSKIKEAVPEFICTTDFRTGIKKTIDFYRKNPRMMRIDYVWDARIDRLIHKYCRENDMPQLRTFSVRYIPQYDESGITFVNRLTYTISRYKAFYLLVKLYRGLKKHVSAIVRAKSRKRRRACRER